ncbi:MAG TPA: hypothetical protein VNR17_10095 [Luteimicrobium sp.]|nr:hypothetical protein [Luteimicrobium sp.]
MRSKIESVPMHEHAAQAPAEARQSARRVEPETPVRVAAWITTGRGKVFRATEAEALAWTTGDHPQVWVRYIDPGGREGFGWLWASAVRRVDVPQHPRDARRSA